MGNVVVGYYRAAKTKAYYEETSASEPVKEMVGYFDAQGVDFSKYDNDKNETTESISFVYAGRPKGRDSGKLWPHSSTVGLSKDGVRLGRYNMSDNLALYVFAHGTGRMVFGWPDLYWSGDWRIMVNRMSDANPQAINDFYRAKPQEMFFWSNVVNTGRWSNIRGRGLVLYHFDASRGGNSSATNRSLAVVEAGGNNQMASAQWPSPGSAASDFFHGGTRSEIGENTTPSLKWYGGPNSGLRIHDIGPAADTLFFAVGTGAVAVLPAKREVTQGFREAPFDLLGRWRAPAAVGPITGGMIRAER